MPIRKLNASPAPGTVEVQCFACQKVVTLSLNTLTLGNLLSSHVVGFPPCACGALEFCQRNFDTISAKDVGGFADLHRRAANALAGMLKDAGRVAPEQRDTELADQRVPSDLPASDLIDLTAVLPPPKQE